MNSVKIFVVGTLLVWRQKWTARPCWVGTLGAHTPLCSPRYWPLGPTVLLGHYSIGHASLLLRLPASSESLAALKSCPSWLLTRPALPCPGPVILFPSLWIDYSEFLTEVESYNIWLISLLRTSLSLGRNEASLCFNYSDMWWYFVKDFIYIFLIANDTFMCWSAFCVSPLLKSLLMSFAHFLTFIFLKFLSFESSHCLQMFTCFSTCC